MSRGKFTAANEQTSEEIRDAADLSDFFAAEIGDQIVINVKRLEPITWEGKRCSGVLGSMTIETKQAHRITDMILERWGGGLMTIQRLTQKPSGGFQFADSIRVEIVGDPILNRPAPAPAPASAPKTPELLPQNWMQYPSPSPYPVPQPQQLSAPLAGLDLPQLIGALAQFSGKNPGNGGSPMDIVALVSALQRSIQPQDDFSKFERMIALQAKMAELQGSKNDSGMDLGSIAILVKELLNQKNAAAQAPQVSAIPNNPPRYAPPPWMSTNASPMRDSPPNVDEHDDESNNEEEDVPFTAEEMAAEIMRMDPAELEKMKDMARQLLLEEQPS